MHFLIVCVCVINLFFLIFAKAKAIICSICMALQAPFIAETLVNVLSNCAVVHTVQQEIVTYC